MGGEDEVQTGGLLASVPEGAATGEDVGQSAEGSSLGYECTALVVVSGLESTALAAVGSNHTNHTADIAASHEN